MHRFQKLGVISIGILVGTCTASADTWETTQAPRLSSIGKWCKGDGTVFYTNSHAPGYTYCGEVKSALLCGPDGQKYIGSASAPAGYIDCSNWPRIYAVGSVGYQHNGTFYPTKEIARETTAIEDSKPLRQPESDSSLDGYLDKLDSLIGNDSKLRSDHKSKRSEPGKLPMLQELEPQIEQILELLTDK